MNNSNNEGGVSQKPSGTEGESYKMPPLLTALILKAGREGHTMQQLASVLDVSYARLNQWRRGESQISNAQRSVHERAAQYLGIPVVLVQALAQSITLPDLFWPDEGDFELRVEAGIKQLFDDVFIGGFVPPALWNTSASVKLFVLFLYRELNAPGMTTRLEPGSASWLRPVRDVLQDVYAVRAAGNA